MDCTHRSRWAGLSLLVALVAGCGLSNVEGSGKFITDERTTDDFRALDVSDGIDATVVVDSTQPTHVRILGDDNLVQRVRTLVAQDGTLHVDFRDKNGAGWTSFNPLRAEVTVPRLESLTRSGGGEVDLSGVISAPTFLLSASGGGTVKAQGLAVQQLNVDLSGAVVTTLAGQANRIKSSTSGGVVMNARELSAQEASLVSSGAGSTVLRVSDSLSVSASGGVEVHILGRPSVVAQDLSGGATLTFE